MNLKNDLSDRLLDFAAEVIKLVTKIKKDDIGKHIGNQLMRSATSCGANYEEACGAQSRADFVHKMQLVLKELKESLFWLKLIKKTELTNTDLLDFNLKEANELTHIIAKSIVTAKSK